MSAMIWEIFPFVVGKAHNADPRGNVPMPDFSGRFVSVRTGLVYEYLVHYERSATEVVWDATFMHQGSVACKPAGVLSLPADVPEEIPRHLVDLAARRAIESILAK